MKKENFSSRFGALMVVAGASVGLGNIWKFPYNLGVNGGFAFLLIYLAFIVLLGIPLITAEFSIGRAAQKNAYDAFGKSKFRFFGALGIITITIILCFYSTIGGWTLAYAYHYISGKFIGMDVAETAKFFGNFVVNSPQVLAWQFLFLLLTAGLLFGGVQKGLERSSKIMMPILFVGLIVLAIRSLSLEGAEKGIVFMFSPDFSKIDGQVLLSAMGQAFFSLGIGSSSLITFGGYLNPKDNLIKMATQVAVADTFVALIAGIVIFPAVFAFGLDPAAGPGLLFITLPNVFETMPMGALIGGFFFILVVFAALTSSIAMLETSTAFFVNHYHYQRKNVLFLLTFFVFVCGGIMTLSQGEWSSYTIFGKSIFDFFDELAEQVLMGITAMGCAIYIGWIKSQDLQNQIKILGQEKMTTYQYFNFLMIRYFAPIAVSIILLQGFFGFIGF